MATRIHPLPAPTEPASPHLEPDAEMLLAPPPNLSKRLTASVHRSLPGWTLQVIVQRWTEDHVKVLVTGQRGADALAPPAPPTGSAAAEKLTDRAERAFEQIVRKNWPDTEWSFRSTYVSDGPNQLRIGLQGKKNDPPTCTDGAGEVIFPGDVRLAEPVLVVRNDPNVERRVFIHWYDDASQPILPTLPAGFTWEAYDNGSWPSPVAMPGLVHPVLPSPPIDDRTFACLVPAGGKLPLIVSQLNRWWVWW